MGVFMLRLCKERVVGLERSLMRELGVIDGK